MNKIRIASLLWFPLMPKIEKEKTEILLESLEAKLMLKFAIYIVSNKTQKSISILSQ